MKIRNILYADDGMVLTNGKTFAKVVYLAEGADESVWHEITDAEYKALNENEI